MTTLKYRSLAALLVVGLLCGLAHAGPKLGTLPAIQLDDQAPQSGRLVIASKGAAAARIEVMPAAAGLVGNAPADLVHYLHAITGARLPQDAAAGADGRIVFDLLDPGAAGRMAQNPEAFVLEITPAQMTIRARTSEGFVDAVYWLLDKLGARWFFAGDAWEELPQGGTLTIAPGLVGDAPDFLQRRIWYGYGVRAEGPARDYRNWMRRNRMDGWLTGSAGHAYAGILDPAEHFDAHPEWFPLVNGKRLKGGQLCLTNPEVRKAGIDYALGSFRRNPDIKMISVSPNDGGGYCECENCAQRSITDNTVIFANLIADAVVKEFPDRLLGMYAYAGNSPPPTIEVHPNVVIFCATAFIRGGLTADQVFAGWSEKSHRMGARAYYHVIIWSANVIRWQVDRLAEQIKDWHASGVMAINTESSNCWGAEGLNYYVASRLMWDSSLEVQDILDDFYLRCFGPAADPMARFYRHVKESEGFLGPDMIKVLAMDLQEAGRLVPSGSRYEQRIDLMKLYLHWLKLRVDSGRAREELDNLTKLRDVIRFSSEIRDTNMVHTYAIYRESRIWRASGLVWGAKVFPGSDQWQVEEPKVDKDDLFADIDNPVKEEPLVKPRIENDPKFALLMSDWKPPARAFSHEEVEAIFQADLADLPAEAALPDQRKFSWDLKPLPGAKDAKVETPSRAMYRGGNRFVALQAEAGTMTLELAPRSGTTTWQVTAWGAPEHVLAEGTAEPGEAPTVAEVALASPGLYQIQLSGGMRRFRITSGPWAWINDGTAHVIGGSGRQYFYVPKGTGAFALRLASPDGSAHVRILDPKGAAALDLRGDFKTGEQFTVKVPAGKDGAVWSYQVGRVEDVSRVELVGVPPLATPDIADMLVPAEVLP